MKYLKRYNEEKNYSEFVEDITEIAEQTLSYLRDNGFAYVIDPNKWEESNGGLIVRIINDKDEPGIKWFDINIIKEDIMQFVELTSMKYEIQFIAFKVDSMYFITPKIHMSVEEFLNDDYAFDEYRNKYEKSDNKYVGHVVMRIKNK